MKSNNQIEIREENKNQIASQYTPLVHKIARQFFTNHKDDYEELVSEGYIGLMYAVDKYNNNTSQVFTQYAAWMIRFHILNYINNGNTTFIKVSADARKRLDKHGKEKPFTVLYPDNSANERSEGKSLDNLDITNNGEKIIQNFVDNEDETTLWFKLFRMLENKFTDREVTIFYKRFGIAGFNIVKGIDLAKEYNTTSVGVTNNCNKIIKYIKKDNKMIDILRRILNIYE